MSSFCQFRGAVNQKVKVQRGRRPRKRSKYTFQSSDSKCVSFGFRTFFCTFFLSLSKKVSSKVIIILYVALTYSFFFLLSSSVCAIVLSVCVGIVGRVTLNLLLGICLLHMGFRALVSQVVLCIYTPIPICQKKNINWSDQCRRLANPLAART